MPSPRRVFLGWDGPVLPAAARWLLETVGPDLSEVMTITPTGRTGRLLRALLVEEAGARGLSISPPRVLGATELDALFEFATEPAGPITRRLAWLGALAQGGVGELGALLAKPPGLDDTAALNRVAALLEGWTHELAAGGYRLSEVELAATSPGAGLPDFADGARWGAAGRLQGLYERLLRERGMHDPDLALLDAVREPGSAAWRAGRLVFVGLPQLAAVARLAASCHPDATILVAAPEQRSGAFDALGCLDPQCWGDAERASPVEIDGAGLFVVDSPADQAACAMSCLASLGGAFAAEDVVVVTPDDEVPPHLMTAGRRVAPGRRGLIDIRSATGRPLNQTPPVTLVRAIRDFMVEGSFEAYAGLVRHPDAERRLAVLQGAGAEDSASAPGSGRGRGGGGGIARAPIENWLGVLDRYASQGLPDTAAGPWRTSQASHRAKLESLRAGVDTMLAPLLASPMGTPAHWSRALLETLAAIYGGRRSGVVRRTLERVAAACDQVRAVAVDLSRAPAHEMSGADALSLVLDALDGASLPGEASRGSIEMVGWLDLGLDPAPVAIITGFNEGKVPPDPAPTPLLPERLREALGLSTSRARLARDAYLMTLATRSRARVFVIAGRRTVAGDPLRPSRVLFLCDDEAATARLRLAAGRSGRAWPARVAVRAMGAPGASVEAMPVRDDPLPASLPVSSLACYLRCPYEFYLRYVLGAQDVEEPEPEMSARLFGSLIHQALAGLAGVDAGGSDDPGLVSEALGDLLSEAARLCVGPRPRAALRLQVEVARQRLELLAPHQAARAGAGWRLLAAERGVERGQAFLSVDGVRQGLHGRIDRIDLHPELGLAVLDYKAGNEPPTPEQAHRRATGEERWKDLQLPMYRHLLPAMLGSLAGGDDGARIGPETAVSMGYVRVGASAEYVGFEMAEWTAADLASADATASGVVRAIRGREFRRAVRVPEQRVMAALCGAGAMASGSLPEAVSP